MIFPSAGTATRESLGECSLHSESRSSHSLLSLDADVREQIYLRYLDITLERPNAVYLTAYICRTPSCSRINYIV